jgi:hypothetical protein
VEGKTRRLAVECDGEKWHTHEELQYDSERQAILERLGWIFVRIRGSVFFRDPDAAMRPVFAKLDHLGIEPQVREPEPSESECYSLIERLRKKAESLREQWRLEREGESSLKRRGPTILEIQPVLLNRRKFAAR